MLTPSTPSKSIALAASRSFKSQISKTQYSVQVSIYTTSDRWIRDGQIYRLADVRKLPLVLGDDEAKAAFINGGVRSIENAIDIAEANRRKAFTPLRENPPSQPQGMGVLAEALLDKVKSLPRQDYVALRDRQYEAADQEVDILTDLAEHLQDLLQDVSK